MKTYRLPPHDLETEQAIIGCQICSPNECISEVLEKTSGNIESFYDLRHQNLQKVMFEMWNEQTPIDLITLQTRLRAAGLLEQVGGLIYLMELQNVVTSTHNLKEYLKVLGGNFMLRQMLKTCFKFSTMAMENQGDYENVVEQFERESLALRKIRGSDGLKPIKETVHEALADIEAMFSRQGEISGLSTGLSDLDRETDGLHGGEYILIAAFPSVGKTSLAMNIAEHVALNLGLPVGIFSAEMSARSLVKRAIASVGRVNMREIRNGVMNEGDFPRIHTAAAKIAKSNLHIDDTSDMTAQQMRARARRMVQQHGIKLFIADYAQLFSSPGAENRTNEVDQVSKAFKNMAKELDVPVIVLSQLTEDAKGNVHLKGARALGEDADGYWLLKRPKGSVTNPNDLTEPIELWLQKQRNEARGMCINLTFLKTFTRFEQAAKFEREDVPTYDR